MNEKINAWIGKNLSKCKTIRPSRSSYKYKHICEREINEYVSNEEFIAAMEGLGFEAKPCFLGSKNRFFNAVYLNAKVSE